VSRLFLLSILFVLLPAQAGDLDDARVLLEEQRLDEARAVLERSVANPRTETEALVLLTRVCNEQEAYEDGIDYGKRLVALLPESSEAHLLYAQAVRIKLSKVSKVKAMFSLGTYKNELNRALELDGENADAMEEKIGFLAHAPGMAGGDLDEAATWVEKLKRLDPERGTILEAELEFKKGNEERGLEIWRNALQKNPADGDLRLRLAYWYQSHEKWHEADREFELLTAGEDPRLVLLGLYQRGRTRVLGEFEPQKAVELMAEYVEKLGEPSPTLPSASSAWWRSGNAWEQIGDTGAARRAYDTALRLDPDNKEARKALKALR
jgi:tetratricopeptide (TPR) repeat protein